MMRVCDEQCNQCGRNQKSDNCYIVLARFMFKADLSIQIAMIQEINRVCPNLSVCPDCGLDDFFHVNGCNYIQLVEGGNK